MSFLRTEFTPSPLPSDIIHELRKVAAGGFSFIVRARHSVKESTPPTTNVKLTLANFPTKQ